MRYKGGRAKCSSTSPALTTLIMMGSNMADLTYDIARQLLKYEPETGKLFWKERPREMFPADRHWKMWNTRFAGSEAFTSVDGSGYRHGGIFARIYKAHRVIWLMQTREWPSEQIDHINGVRDDNRFGNFRSVSSAENSRNRSLAVNNISGVTGVFWRKRTQKWHAQIDIDGCRIRLGCFAAIEDAIAARSAANIAHGFSDRHGDPRP